MSLALVPPGSAVSQDSPAVGGPVARALPVSAARGRSRWRRALRGAAPLAAPASPPALAPPEVGGAARGPALDPSPRLGRPLPPLRPLRCVPSLPPSPPLLPGGAAREVCAGRRAGRGGGTRGRGGGRGGGDGDGGWSPAWVWDGGWRPVRTEGQGWRCRCPVLAGGLAAVCCKEWRRPPGAASPHCPLLRRLLAGDRHRVAGFPRA